MQIEDAVKDVLPEAIEAPIEEVQEPKKSLKEELRENYKAAQEKESPKTVEDAPKEPKPVKVDKVTPGKAVAAPLNTKEPIEPKPSLPPITAPLGWKSETKAKWDKLPREIQEEVNRRETEMEKKLSQVDEVRQFGKKIQDVVNPYTPLIRQSGSTPEQAITELLNYAQILQTGSAASKGQLLHSLAQRWGADMRMTPQAANQPAFQLQALQQELMQTKKQLADLPTMLQQQQEEAKLKSVIDAFAADPKNIHYERVKPVMASLLSSDGAKDMQDAYDKACYADPDIRSTLLIEQKKAEEAARSAERKAKAETARNVGSSIKGSSNLNGVSIAPVKRSLREELQANFRAVTEH